MHHFSKPPAVSEALRQRLARKRLNFHQINYIARTIHAIERAKRPLAILPEGTLLKWGLTPQIAECDRRQLELPAVLPHENMLPELRCRW